MIHVSSFLSPLGNKVASLTCGTDRGLSAADWGQRSPTVVDRSNSTGTRSADPSMFACARRQYGRSSMRARKGPDGMCCAPAGAGARRLTSFVSNPALRATVFSSRPGMERIEPTTRAGSIRSAAPTGCAALRLVPVLADSLRSSRTRPCGPPCSHPVQAWNALSPPRGRAQSVRQPRRDVLRSGWCRCSQTHFVRLEPGPAGHRVLIPSRHGTH